MTRNEEYLKTILDALGGDSTKIPPYTINSEDDLKYIAAAFEERAANKGKFIVTLTPTSPDYSGTMDKTVSEINAAYEAGQEIWANISAQGKNLYIPLKMASTDGTIQYPSFDFCAYDATSNLMILAYTAYTDDGTKQTYSTTVYSLTPAS